MAVLTERLRHMMNSLLAEDIQFYGRRPPFTYSAPIPKSELENLYPEAGSMRWRTDLRHVFAANLRRCAVLGPRTQLAGTICPLPKAKAGTSAQLAHLPVRAV
jgi:hypothetical protein